MQFLLYLFLKGLSPTQNNYLFRNSCFDAPDEENTAMIIQVKDE